MYSHANSWTNWNFDLCLMNSQDHQNSQRPWMSATNSIVINDTNVNLLLVLAVKTWSPKSLRFTVSSGNHRYCICTNVNASPSNSCFWLPPAKKTKCQPHGGPRVKVRRSSKLAIHCGPWIYTFLWQSSQYVVEVF